jgi:prolyl 4-hydroxylase
MVKAIALEMQAGATPAVSSFAVHADSAQPASAAKAPAEPGYSPEPSRIKNVNTVGTLDRVVRVVARWTRPDVILLSEVLSAEECRELIDMARPKMAQSTVVDRAKVDGVVHHARTSTGTFFDLCENELVARIDKRLAALVDWPVSHGEGLQILRYQVGGQYRPHFDYFPWSDAASPAHLAQGGQRIGTVIIYLNDVEDGGETVFPEVGLSIVPRRGAAVYFGYCNSRGQVDPLTLHGGAAVRRGEKWIATKWLRQSARS